MAEYWLQRKQRTPAVQSAERNKEFLREIQPLFKFLTRICEYVQMYACTYVCETEKELER